MPIILDGNAAAAALLGKAQAELALLSVQPHLHVIRLGDDPASVSYTRMKAKRAKKIGLASTLTELPADTTQEALLEFIAQLNADPNTHGILVQLPFPKESQIAERVVLEAIH
ncbi:MAG: tetrahydrofolate dehydrogenase/cyclohydrolase catalytic domain-containing protein, partial [Deinococcales bacterium]